MKAIYLTPEEHQMLTEVLKNCLSDLRMEIVATDHFDFKQRLRERKAAVILLLEKLEKATPMQEAA